MKIRCSDVGKEGLHIVTYRKPEWLTNIPEIVSEGEETHISSNIDFDLRVTRVLKEITVMGNLRFSITSPCARCLTPVDLTLSPEVKLVLSPAPVLKEEDEEDDTDYETYSGEEVDIGDYLREVVAMALPIKILCREDCLGLCPYCGANLNVERCSCKEEWVDPRFAVLRNIKI